MKQELDIFTIDLQDGQHCSLQSIHEANGVTEYEFHLRWTAENAAADHKFVISWSTPEVGMMHKWTPSCGLCRNFIADWGGGFQSMTSHSAPLYCAFDGNNLNHYCWSLSECQKMTMIKSGIIEENGNLLCQFSLGTGQYTNQYEATITLRVDQRQIPLYDTVADVAAWWESLGMTPAFVPAAAKEPCYSFWYSYHQNMTDKDVEAECRRAKELGFDVCIIDDGWQTEDNSRGYGFCGDWKPAPSKFPDMASHVAEVHKIGMKYVIWYSVPFVGYYSEHYDHFKSMLLRKDDRLNTGVLDPRYQEVRDFLVNIYKTALVNWNLDGFKLDFIDTWRDDPGNAPYSDGMDIPSLQNAVQLFMTTVMQELKAIKPDILLEFRQGYIGPHMRTFGNMFRVGDCPGDYTSNRVGVFDLRMLMGNSAVHSDMLMWHKDESAELDALQIISIMFGVMQYSARLDIQTPRVKKMSKFWLDFLASHKNVLLEGKLRSYDAHQLYTWAQATADNTCIAAVYAGDKCIQPEALDTVYIANGSTVNRVLAELEGRYQVTVLNCCGEETEYAVRDFRGINILNIPVGGMAILNRA